jgi:hypothetical protein
MSNKIKLVIDIAWCVLLCGGYGYFCYWVNDRHDFHVGLFWLVTSFFGLFLIAGIIAAIIDCKKDKK